MPSSAAFIEALWSRLDERAPALSNLTAQPKPDWSEAIRRIDELLPDIRELVALNASKVIAARPDLKARITERATEAPAATITSAPVVLYGGATETQVMDLWEHMVRKNIDAAVQYIQDRRQLPSQWMMGWVEMNDEVYPFFRAEHCRDALREARKGAQLLTTARMPLRLKPGKAIFEEDFQTGMGAFKFYGPGHFSVDEGMLRVNGAGCTFWMREDLSNTLLAFDFQPLAKQGKGAGALFAFPAIPRPGETYAASAGEMVLYNYGIDTYHCSLCRGTSVMTNLRRTGRGLRMLSTISPDPCAEFNRTYRVELLKYNATVQVHVDGKLLHSYYDAGVYGKPLSRGRFGVRHFSAHRLDARYGNFSATTLK